MTSDLELLGQFAREKSQDAFTTLVSRHVNLVYSAALRQVRSPQLAEEVAQSVFADLARDAGKISGTGFQPVNSLTPWLYLVTRRTAIDVIRKESRRQLREQIAVEMTNMNATSAEWTQIEPLLDDAMAALDETDRTAILLRYFENKNLREVGEALGTNDDAAQKRVSRAVERLREFFSKRNVTIGAGALAVVISANAVQAAPAALVATISAAAVLAGTTVHTSAVIAATKTIAMTTLQKTVITAALAAAVGTGIFEAHQVAQLREQNQMLQQQQAPLAGQIQQLQRERDDATNRLASLLAENSQLKSNSNENELLKLRGEVTQLRTQANDETASVAKAWLDKVNKLKERLGENPNARIPEMQFLTEKNWLDAASGKLETEGDFRRAMASLRSAAEQRFISLLQPALNEYLKANGKQFPTDMDQLHPYFSQPIDEAILQRWKIIGGNNAPVRMNGSDWVVTQKAPVDDVFDTSFSVTENGEGSSDFLYADGQMTLAPVYAAFDAANPNHGSGPPPTAQLLPFAKTPEQQAALQKLILRESATGN